MRSSRRALLVAVLATSCTLPEPEPLPPDSFAFGVFGDGPYRGWENGRFRRLVEDVNRTDQEWFLHVGDILWYPCSDAEFRERFQALDGIRHPVVYTPGGNEWTDCHEPIAGRYDPLDRLRSLRAIFFPQPGRTFGGTEMEVVPQSADSAWAEFVENVRWSRGGFVFATVHLVGSGNATESFPGRTEANDQEAARRMDAAVEVLANFTRVETFGSPNVGWVRVVLDSVAGRVVGTEPRVMPGWWLW